MRTSPTNTIPCLLNMVSYLALNFLCMLRPVWGMCCVLCTILFGLVVIGVRKFALLWTMSNVRMGQ